MHDIIIIGAGPAGLSAALYALRANKKVLIFEEMVYGGQIINAPVIENYPGITNISGFDFVENLYNQVISLGGIIKYEKVIKITSDKIVTTNKDTYKSKSIIIATGLKTKKLGIENEDSLLGKGISYCATCDGNFYKDKIVAVVGGGNTALTDVLYLSQIAKKVYLIHRSENFRGDLKYLNEIKAKDNIEFILNSEVTALNGKDNLTSIIVKNKDLKEKVILLSALFIAIGQLPKNESFIDLIETDDKGYILSSDGVHTNIDGIYVAGDIKAKTLRQLITAASDGAIAASTIISEIN